MAAKPATTPASPQSFTPCAPGPWGKLEYRAIYLEAPDEVLAKFPLPNPHTCWSFALPNAEALGRVLATAGLPDACRTRLLNNITRDDNALHVQPTSADLASLTPVMRSSLYRELAKCPLNEFAADPILIHEDSVEAWVAGTGLRPELVDLIKKYVYYRGELLVLSDLAPIIGAAKSDAEARELMHVFTRGKTLLLNLKIDPSADVPALRKYWTAGDRNKDAIPLLQSLADSCGTCVAEATLFLPSLPRRLLYTYPRMEMAMEGRLPDCHWTSLNFFSHNPQNYFLDLRLTSSAVLENYAKITPPYQLGDVLIFLDGASGNALHSCVQIADDVVFTKNGENLLSPWVLMKRKDVETTYLHEGGSATVQGFRKLTDR